MKKKLTTLLFGLLLAVGWTGNASAQALPNGGYADRLGLTEVTAPQGTSDVVKKAQKKTSQQLMSTNTGASTRMNAPKRADANPEMVSLTRAQAEALTYKWRDAQNVEHESNAAQEATDPYQMYELLRFVYGNPAFPGPRYTAWSNNDTREREVYYGPMEGGWDLVAASSAVQTGDDIVITVASGYVGIKSIYVYNGSTALTYWVGGTGTTAGTSPSSWIYDTNTDYYSTCRWISNGDGSWWLTYGDNTGGAGGKITIPYSALQGATNVRVVINTKTDDGYTQKFVDYDEDEAVDTLMAFAKLMKDYKNTYISQDAANISTGFKNGRIGAGVDGSWNYQADKSALGSNFGAAKLPTIKVNGTDKQIIPIAGYKYLGVNSYSYHQRAAHMLAYYLSSEACQLERAQQLGWGPSNLNAQEAVSDDPVMKALADQSHYSVPQVNVSGTFWTPMGTLGSEMYKDSWDPANRSKTTTLLRRVVENIKDY